MTFDHFDQFQTLAILAIFAIFEFLRLIIDSVALISAKKGLNLKMQLVLRNKVSAFFVSYQN